MPWSPQPTITVNGVNRNSVTLTDVQISYGRTSVWEQARAGYAQIAVVNNSNTDFSFDMNQTVTIKVKNSSGSDVTVFTGIISSVNNSIAGSGTIGTSVIQTITAVGPFSQMSRKIIGTTSWAKEFDTDRMTRIFNDAGMTIDTVDTPSIYELQARNASAGDAYTLAAQYATYSNGYIYETPSGKVGFANESRRFIDQRDNGYKVIPNNYIIWNSVSSQKTLSDIVNSILVSWRAGTESSQDTTSQATYGLIAGSISTELHNATDAQTQAARYIALRAYPRTSLSTFTIPLTNSNVTNSDIDYFLNMTTSKPIQITSLPIGIKNTTYRGFVEGYTLSINKFETFISLNTTDYTYSVTPTRWQDVSASLQWSGVGAAVQWATYDD